MAEAKGFAVGVVMPVITRHVTQEKINLFEACSVAERTNVHNNPEMAARRFGTSQPIASGRMSITYASEALRRFLGPDVFHKTGKVNLKFLRPVKEGDTISVKGEVTEINDDADGKQIVVEIRCQNQNGDLTAVGQGRASLPE